MLTSRDLDLGRSAANALSDQDLSAEAVHLEMTSLADIDALAEYLKNTHGRVDVLINNAGILIDGELNNPIGITDADVIRKTIEVNAIAPMMLIKALLPLMHRADFGRIINISSSMGQLSDMGGSNADRSPEQGIDTAVRLAISSDASQSGGFYRDRQIVDW